MNLRSYELERRKNQLSVSLKIIGAEIITLKKQIKRFRKNPVLRGCKAQLNKLENKLHSLYTELSKEHADIIKRIAEYDEHKKNKKDNKRRTR